MGSEWVQSGFKVGSEWVQSGFREGFRVGLECVQTGFKVGSTGTVPVGAFQSGASAHDAGALELHP